MSIFRTKNGKRQMLIFRRWKLDKSGNRVYPKTAKAFAIWLTL